VVDEVEQIAIDRAKALFDAINDNDLKRLV